MLSSSWSNIWTDDLDMSRSVIKSNIYFFQIQPTILFNRNKLQNLQTKEEKKLNLMSQSRIYNQTALAKLKEDTLSG